MYGYLNFRIFPPFRLEPKPMSIRNSRGNSRMFRFVAFCESPEIAKRIIFWRLRASPRYPDYGGGVAIYSSIPGRFPDFAEKLLASLNSKTALGIRDFPEYSVLSNFIAFSGEFFRYSQRFFVAFAPHVLDTRNTAGNLLFIAQFRPISHHSPMNF